MDDAKAYPRAEECFNRTFMELKWKKLLFTRLRSLSFNRTFMELKLRNIFSPNLQIWVLIVPLWN